MGTETHDYTVALKANQALNVVVKQLGVNVVVIVSAPDGLVITEVNETGARGSESVWIVSAAAGDHGIKVRPLSQEGAGSYELHVAALKDAALATRASTLLVQLDPKAMLDASGFNYIPGATPVYYSTGYEQGAKSLRDALKPAIDFFESKLQVKVTVHLAVLAPDDWARLIARPPYGVPWMALSLRDPATSSPWNGAVFMSATKEGILPGMPTADLQRPGALSPDLAAGLKATGLSFEDGMRLASDETMYHELGHVYTFAYGIAPPRWLAEFLAAFLYVAYEAEFPRPGDPGRAFFAAYMDYTLRTYRPKQRVALDAIGGTRQGGGLGDDYGWYQLHFKKRAEDVYKAQGLAFLQRVREAFPSTVHTHWDIDERLTLEETLARLEKISPGFVKWAADLAAHVPPGGAR